ARGLLAFGHAPGMELVEAGELESFEEVSAEARSRRLQLAGRRLGETVADEGLQLADVDGDVRDVDLDAVAVGEHARPSRLVQQAADLREAPAQRAARLVGNPPQELAELLAAEAPAMQGEPGEEGARLARWRQLELRAVPEQLEFAEKTDFQPAHVCRIGSPDPPTIEPGRAGFQGSRRCGRSRGSGAECVGRPENHGRSHGGYPAPAATFAARCRLRGTAPHRRRIEHGA